MRHTIHSHTCDKVLSKIGFRGGDGLCGNRKCFPRMGGDNALPYKNIWIMVERYFRNCSLIESLE